jgi:hypothetical protein
MKRASIFAMHQFLATLGVLLWSGVLTSMVLGIPRIWGGVFFLTDVRNVLTAKPYYPVEIIVGLLSGWLVWRQFHHRVMLWIWVFPLITLAIGMLEGSTRMSPSYPGAVVSNFRPMLSHFFGYGCRIESNCFDQIGMTLPFYMALSYAGEVGWHCGSQCVLDL